MMTTNMINIPRDDVAEMVKEYAILARSQPATQEGWVRARDYQAKSNRLRDMLDAPPTNQVWPKLERAAKVGGGRFQAGVSTKLVVEAAQRLYDHDVTPEKEAERIARCSSFVASLHRQDVTLGASQDSQPSSTRDSDHDFGRLTELETFERRYKLLQGAVAGDKLTISIDHGDYTQYIDSGAELDGSLDDPQSILRGHQS